MNDLARGIFRDRERLTTAFERVLDSGYVVMGPNHNEFQRALAAYLGVKHVLGVASGTDALELAIKTVMPAGRNTVVTAANAGGYTSVAAKHAGFSVRYADVDSESLCVSLETLVPSLTDDVGVVVVTHLYGNLTDVTNLVSYCHNRGIRVVEDCAQAIGATLDGKSAGSFGDIAATSFYPTKNLGAIGDGGAIATSNDEFAAIVAQLRQYGWSTKYRVEIPAGTNSRLDEMQAAFLLARLPLLDGFNERRRDIIERYRAAAAGGPLRVLPALGGHHVGHLAVALTANRDYVRAALLALGVQTDIHFPIPDYAQLGFGSDLQSLATTDRISKEILSLPCFPELTDEEIQQVCGAIESLK
ncbi:DegT/DnrJ/EryC1/StrS aminotransferase family protein [Cryobacterium sp. LW097]|uniref:DegT/DnrJ/EryC1/StrS family aminotransferase n=1 Tax=Cryobacterium sp. LW097 TaxID=1978566 RepID=UPI001248692F|nr:DegT/DnrJ/EryC1/StrS family aminotransferase [Cryobacterium sp. LW097]